jgi:PPOX class probable F420-dependent enzyme
MTARSPEPSDVLPLQLSAGEIDELLAARLIANLASINPNGTVHLVAMWFRRDGDSILFPTSHHTRKARNLRRHPQATAMIDRSRSGLDLRGVQIKGSVELIEGAQAQRLNRSIHERYITAKGLAEDPVIAYLSEGDDVTVRLSIERIST